jgi:hypothetical protein
MYFMEALRKRRGENHGKLGSPSLSKRGILGEFLMKHAQFLNLGLVKKMWLMVSSLRGVRL